MSINRSLLLEKSNIFKNSTLVDNIHQTIIDLQFDPQNEQIQKLFDKSFICLNYKMDLQTMTELTNFISYCFSQIKEDNDENINKIYENIDKYSNKLVALSFLYPQIKEIQSKSLIIF